MGQAKPIVNLTIKDLCTHHKTNNLFIYCRLFFVDMTKNIYTRIDIQHVYTHFITNFYILLQIINIQKHTITVGIMKVMTLNICNTGRTGTEEFFIFFTVFCLKKSNNFRYHLHPHSYFHLLHFAMNLIKMCSLAHARW